jgi:indolepyruvate ferredoxin oxidoreductase beta subunit
MNEKTTNVVIAGLGGQGVLKASDILADAAFRAGLDVKKAEVHGMSQRGGSVACDVRFGAKVLSPMVPAGEADFLLVLEPTQADPNRHVLSTKLAIDEQHWLAAIHAALPEKLYKMNADVFQGGRNGGLNLASR